MLSIYKRSRDTRDLNIEFTIKEVKTSRKYFKGCLFSGVFREMQIKISLRLLLTTFRMDSNQNN